MKTIKSIKAMQAWAEEQRKQGKTIGFVPTMGYLHQGHLSLVKKSVQENDLTVVSIFVNPLQFALNEDLDKYPRDFARDEKLCQEEKADVIFYPDEKEMYVRPQMTFAEVEPLTQVLCGQSRPTHFRGVTTVCLKLFNIVKPHQAYFGLKDYQQYVVIKKMVEDLNLDLKIVAGPIVREADGLALSSRNQYLSPEEREQATVLSFALRNALHAVSHGLTEAEEVKQRIRSVIESKPLAKIDYAEIVSPYGLKSVEKVSKGDVALLAVYFGQTRLIDNLVFE